MDKALRGLAGIVGIFFTLSGVRWLAQPEAAAKELGLPLLDGIARSTEIGDLGAFFFAGGIIILLGVWKQKAEWLVAPALLVGTAAIFRILAALLHDAELALPFIVIELLMAGILVMAARAASRSA